MGVYTSMFGGVNLSYLRRLVLDWKCTPSVYRHERESDLHQSIYPEGFYDVRPSPPCSSALP